MAISLFGESCRLAGVQHATACVAVGAQPADSRVVADLAYFWSGSQLGAKATAALAKTVTGYTGERVLSGSTAIYA